ncbi:MAG: energy-coupled thiamine transporter ThiT [Lachnospirales bacterium]
MKITTKKLTLMALLIALSTVLSFSPIKLPQGGSITFLSMFFIVIIGYFLDPKLGLLSGFIYGLIQFAMGGYFLTIPQFCLDYIFAFSALGFGAFVYRKKSKFSLEIVCVISMLARLFFVFLAGIVFYGDYAPEGMPVALYSIVYNSTYIIPELILTLVVLRIPIFRTTLYKVMSRFSDMNLVDVPNI